MRMEKSVLAPTPTRMEKDIITSISGKLMVTPAMPIEPMP
jgi:hypothetical protein